MTVLNEALLADGEEAAKPGLADVLKAFWPIGLLSFGGTQANMAMFLKMLVEELKWTGKSQYAELLGVVQSLPGPSAVQILLCSVTVATGSPFYGVLAVIFFILPAAVVMALIGSHLSEGGSSMAQQYQMEMKPLEAAIGCVAIALVAGGTWELGQKLVNDKLTKFLWLITCTVCFATATMPTLNSVATLACLVLSALVALTYYPPKEEEPKNSEDGVAENSVTVAVGISTITGHILFWSSWFLLAVLFAWELSGMEMPATLKMVAPYYRVGCLVFGGGPVVIPLLLFELISCGMINAGEFSLGLAVVQLMPGPMFNMSAFCGSLKGGLSGALLCWAAMNLPGITMALGALPFYASLRGKDSIQRALKGVNAAAAGLMGAALLLLWQTIVGVSSTRVVISLLFIGLQQILSVKAYWLVLCGICLGLASMALGVEY